MESFINFLKSAEIMKVLPHKFIVMVSYVWACHYYVCTIVAELTATTPAVVSPAEQDNVTITCTATDVPVPSITWSRAVGSNLTDFRTAISETSSTMVITDMDSSDTYQVTQNLTIIYILPEDNEAVYTCTVSNAMNSVHSNVTIISELSIHIVQTASIHT